MRHGATQGDGLEQALAERSFETEEEGEEEQRIRRGPSKPSSAGSGGIAELGEEEGGPEGLGSSKAVARFAIERGSFPRET